MIRWSQLLPRLLPLVCALLGCVVTSPAVAQRAAPIGAAEVFAGGEEENYLRNLNVLGYGAAQPWSLRNFGPRQIERLAPADSLDHPWRQRFRFDVPGQWAMRYGLIEPRIQTSYNSDFPYGFNNGALWEGRGLNTAVQAGAYAAVGPISLVLAPVAFHAQNRVFPLLPNGETGPRRFGQAGHFREQIDLPQRFGDEPYSRIDPGQSTLRVDLLGVAAGVSTANQIWGPADAHPIVLGTNAAGFPHAFIGSSQPWNIGIGRLHGRVMWGKLEQSEYSPQPDSLGRRFSSAIVAVFQPRGVPGFEIGGGRFFHEAWPATGLSNAYLLRPFESLIKVDLVNRAPDPENPGEPLLPNSNQLASVFARWVSRSNGFEVYGEYGKEDHNYDVRDLILQPDHNAGYLLGFRKVWQLRGGQLLALRGETLNLQATHIHRARQQSPFYQHADLRQGHTQLGQALGSAAGFGGGASLLALDGYHRRGRVTLLWDRQLRGERETFWRNGFQIDRAVDVAYSLGAETLLFMPWFDVSFGMRGVYNVNRNFESDATNLNATFGLRARLP
jgi:hypothetical protein